jgi:hypothetical protein
MAKVRDEMLDQRGVIVETHFLAEDVQGSRSVC